jgi:hypothetical protein
MVGKEWGEEKDKDAARDRAEGKAEEVVKDEVNDLNKGYNNSEVLQNNKKYLQRGRTMAGLNQKGPMNEGPMTGRGRGLCGKNDDRQGYLEREGAGLGRGMGRCGGQGMGWRMRFAQQNVPPSNRTEVDERSLHNQVEMLEAELARIKKQLQDQI